MMLYCELSRYVVIIFSLLVIIAGQVSKVGCWELCQFLGEEACILPFSVVLVLPIVSGFMSLRYLIFKL